MWWAIGAWALVSMAMAEHGTLGLLAGVLAGLAAYWIDVLLHPWARCWYCKGKPRVFDIRDLCWRDCWKCGGTGKRRRVLAGGRLP